jgi:hypothetical protein
MDHLDSPSEEFLTALVSASTARSPLPEQLTRFYDEAKHLSYRFEKKDPFLHPYEGLVSVFHPQVTAAAAHFTKRRMVYPNDPDFVAPLALEMSCNEGDPSFVQDGLSGFRKNWDVFTQGALSNLNWYAVFECLF